MTIPLRVLLVEDCESDAELTICALRAGGYDPVVRRVDTATGLMAALETETWDVILSDHRMPGFSSVEALRLVQARDLDIPFLIVSGTIGEEAAVAGMRDGAHDYILKGNLTRLPVAVERELREAAGHRARRDAEQRQREAEERYRTLVEQIPAVTYIAGASDASPLSIRFVSPQIEAIAGYTPDEWVGGGENWMRALHPEDRERVLAELEESRRNVGRFVSEYRMITRNGDVVWLRDEGQWSEDPDSGSMVLQGFAVDISEKKRAEETIERLAYCDSLTGLPNRVSLHQRLAEAIAAARDGNQPLALLDLGLNRFREINNTLGHHNGDLVLTRVAERLAALTGVALIARVGPARFAIVCPGVDAEGAVRVAERAAHALQAPIVVEGLPIEVGATIGIAMFPGHGEDPELLLRCADTALQAARRGVETLALYTKDQERYDPHRLVLMGELRTAIDAGQLRLEYQPKIDLRSRRVLAVEALVRWRHPELGNVRPDEFIGLAEESSLIRPLTRWILNEAFRQCRAWHQQGIEICISVNLSARNLQDPDLAAQIESLLQTWGVSPGWITLEITESAIMADPNRAAQTLERLSQRGVSLSIDDFGTGYSSLAYLRRLPVSEVKIDRSFVIGLSSQQGDLAIVRTVVDLGHHLGLSVVAEGVEDARTWDLLADLGCDLAQGYYMARPMPASDFEGWVRSGTYGLGEAPKTEPEGD